MAKTPSQMVALGSSAIDFSLPDTVSGELKSLQGLKSESATVVMFICNHCPFVVHVVDELVQLSGEYQQKGVAFVAISSNDVANYPDDSPEKMNQLAAAKGFSFPYLYDESQEIARAYGAECTPDFFVYDGDLKLSYRGQLDDSRPGNGIAVTGKDMRAALDAMLADEPVSPDQKPSIGCNIKWRAAV